MNLTKQVAELVALRVHVAAVVAMAAYFLGVAGTSREARWTAYALLGLTVVDGATGVALSRRTPAG